MNKMRDNGEQFEESCEQIEGNRISVGNTGNYIFRMLKGKKKHDQSQKYENLTKRRCPFNSIAYCFEWIQLTKYAAIDHSSFKRSRMPQRPRGNGRAGQEKNRKGECVTVNKKSQGKSRNNQSCGRDYKQRLAPRCHANTVITNHNMSQLRFVCQVHC